ncbi:MAG: zinc ribbon domain-containing protein [Betaproteobacteria bacterium]|nr:zinc ribbon domain-containing protein [Betaproteobacteria bacterium]
MPIYAYKCAACGFEKDLIQKFSDAPLTQCPACGAEAFSKQLTAPAFQLKGSGWYVTDFRDGVNRRMDKDGALGKRHGDPLSFAQGVGIKYRT